MSSEANSQHALMLDAFVAECGQLGILTKQQLLRAVGTFDPEALALFASLSRALWAPDMRGWERVDVACALATIAPYERQAFVDTVTRLGNNALLPLRWAPPSVAARALRTLVVTTARVHASLWATWSADVLRLCAPTLEYFDAPRVIEALSGLTSDAWSDFIDTVEQLCPVNLDSHNRMRIVVMLAQSKLVEDGRSQLVQRCEPWRSGSTDFFALRESIENFLHPSSNF